MLSLYFKKTLCLALSFWLAVGGTLSGCSSPVQIYKPANTSFIQKLAGGAHGFVPGFRVFEGTVESTSTEEPKVNVPELETEVVIRKNRDGTESMEFSEVNGNGTENGTGSDSISIGVPEFNSTTSCTGDNTSQGTYKDANSAQSGTNAGSDAAENSGSSSQGSNYEFDPMNHGFDGAEGGSNKKFPVKQYENIVQLKAEVDAEKVTLDNKLTSIADVTASIFADIEVNTNKAVTSHNLHVDDLFSTYPAMRALIDNSHRPQILTSSETEFGQKLHQAASSIAFLESQNGETNKTITDLAKQYLASTDTKAASGDIAGAKVSKQALDILLTAMRNSVLIPAPPVAYSDTETNDSPAAVRYSFYQTGQNLFGVALSLDKEGFIGLSESVLENASKSLNIGLGLSQLPNYGDALNIANQSLLQANARFSLGDIQGAQARAATANSLVTMAVNPKLLPVEGSEEKKALNAGTELASSANFLDQEGLTELGTQASVAAGTLLSIGLGLTRFVNLVDLPLSFMELFSGTTVDFAENGTPILRDTSTFERGMALGMVALGAVGFASVGWSAVLGAGILGGITEVLEKQIAKKAGVEAAETIAREAPKVAEQFLNSAGKIGAKTSEEIKAFGRAISDVSEARFRRIVEETIHIKPSKEIQAIHPDVIKFSQSSVNDAGELTASMKKFGWLESADPIDIVKMADGTLITIDNTRVLAASRAEINVKAIVHSADEILNPVQAARLETVKNGIPKNWEEAVKFRINKQSAKYRESYPNGSYITGSVE